MAGVRSEPHPPVPACHLSGRGSLMLELSHGWAATSSSMQSLLLSTWTVLPGWPLFISGGLLSLTMLLPERVEESLVAKAGFPVLLDPVSDPTSLSPPRTDIGKACYTCAVGRCGVSEAHRVHGQHPPGKTRYCG